MVISMISNIECADCIHSIYQSAYRIEADLIGVVTFPPLDRTAYEIRTSENIFYAAMHNDIYLGIIEIEQSLNSQEPAIIASLAVSPAYSRQGVGQLLVKFILERHSPIVVGTAGKNLPAINLNEKLGFTRTRTFFTAEGIPMVELVFGK